MVIWYNFALIYRARHYWLWFTLWYWSYHSWYTYSVSKLPKLIWTRERLSDYDNIFKKNSFEVFVFWRRRRFKLWLRLLDYLWWTWWQLKPNWNKTVWEHKSNRNRIIWNHDTHFISHRQQWTAWWFSNSSFRIW